MHRPTLSLVIAIFSNPPVELCYFCAFSYNHTPTLKLILQFRTYLLYISVILLLLSPPDGEKVRIGYLVRETLKGMRQGAKLKSLIDVNNFRRSQVHPVLYTCMLWWKETQGCKVKLANSPGKPKSVITFTIFHYLEFWGLVNWMCRMLNTGLLRVLSALAPKLAHILLSPFCLDFLMMAIGPMLNWVDPPATSHTNVFSYINNCFWRISHEYNWF